MSPMADPQPRLPTVSVLSVNRPLHAPHAARVRKEVQARLQRGERSFVLCLAQVSDVDAAGIGELVRAYNVTTAYGGTLRITHATAHVRRILDRVGLLDLLGADA